jgi:hypothetical protein
VGQELGATSCHSFGSRRASHPTPPGFEVRSIKVEFLAENMTLRQEFSKYYDYLQILILLTASVV